MMLNMSSMTSGMMDNKSEMTSHPMSESKSQTFMSDMPMNHCESQKSADSNCGDDNDCGFCMVHCSAALISDIEVLGDSSQFSFKPRYQVEDIISKQSRLLRPPKLT